MFSREFERREPEKEGVIFVIFRDGKVLLENRTTLNKVYYGYTIIPGGKVEFGESHDEAAEREILEECGVRSTKITLLGSFLHVTISNNLYHTSAYLITEFEGEFANNENKAEHLWGDFEEAESLLQFAESKYVLQLAKNALIDQGLLKD